MKIHVINPNTSAGMTEAIRRSALAAASSGTEIFCSCLERGPSYASCAYDNVVVSYELLEKAVNAAREKGIRYHVGNILSSDMFYRRPMPEGSLTWKDMGVMAVEMEAAALYANAAEAGANALAMLTISDSLVTGESTSSEERQTAFTDMMEVALSIA